MKRIVAAATSSAATLGLVLAPTANATTDAEFIQQVADAGISWAGETRPSDRDLVYEAHAICSWKATGVTWATATQVQIDVKLNEAQAKQFVDIAVNAYCYDDIEYHE